MPLIKAVNIPGIPPEVIFDNNKNIGSLSEDVLRFFKENVIPQVSSIAKAESIMSDFDTTYLKNASEQGSDANKFFVDNISPILIDLGKEDNPSKLLKGLTDLKNNPDSFRTIGDTITLGKDFDSASVDTKISNIASELENSGSFIDNFGGSQHIARAKKEDIKNVTSKLQDFANNNPDQKSFIQNEIIDAIYTDSHKSTIKHKVPVSVGLVIQGMLDEEGKVMDDILYMMPLSLAKDEDYFEKDENGDLKIGDSGVYVLTDEGKENIIKDVINPKDSKIYAKYSTDKENDTKNVFRKMNRELSVLLDIVQKQKNQGADISYRVANSPSISKLASLQLGKRPVKTSKTKRETKAESNEIYKKINNGTYKTNSGKSISDSYTSISNVAKSLKNYDDLEGYLKQLSDIYDTEETEDSIGDNLDNVNIPINKIYDLVRWHISNKGGKSVDTLYNELESRYEEDGNVNNVPLVLKNRGMQDYANGMLNDEEKKNVKYIDSSLFNFLESEDGDRLRTYLESDSVGTIFNKGFTLEHVYPLDFISKIVWEYFIKSKEDGKLEKEVKEGLEYILKSLYKEAFISNNKNSQLSGKSSDKVQLSKSDYDKIYDLNIDDDIEWKRYKDVGFPTQPKYSDMLTAFPPGSRVDGITYGDIYVPDKQKMTESVTSLLFTYY